MLTLTICIVFQHNFPPIVDHGSPTATSRLRGARATLQAGASARRRLSIAAAAFAAATAACALAVATAAAATATVAARSESQPDRRKSAGRRFRRASS